MAVSVLSALTVEAPAQIKVQTITQSTSTLTIDRSKGEYVKITLNANVTSVVINGWPASGIVGRVQMEITNGGSYTISGWPVGTRWVESYVPVVTSGAGSIDLIVLSSINSGTTILGSVAGQNFK